MSFCIAHVQARNAACQRAWDPTYQFSQRGAAAQVFERECAVWVSPVWLVRTVYDYLFGSECPCQKYRTYTVYIYGSGQP